MMNYTFVFEDTLKLFISLLSILNPLGIIPIFITLTIGFSEDKVKSIATSCSVTVSITLVVSLVLGKGILDFFGISLASFSIGGGILIFSMAMQMVSARMASQKLNEKEKHELNPSEIGIVPLAIPLLAGPGTISQAIIYSNKLTSPAYWLGSAITVLIIGILIKFTFQYSRFIGKKLGTIGLNVMTRIMGLIILSLSIEIIASGVLEILPGLGRLR